MSGEKKESSKHPRLLLYAVQMQCTHTLLQTRFPIKKENTHIQPHCVVYTPLLLSTQHTQHSIPAYGLPSNLSISARLVFVLTTPPTPNAGIILPILAKELFTQSLSTLAALSALPTPCLLYRSKPSRCNGVLTSWTAAGVRNCAALAAPTYCLTFALMAALSFGETMAGRLKEAKMVMLSRMVKSTKVGSGTGRVDADGLPKSWVKRLSLYKHSARFVVDVATNFDVPAVVVVEG
jgi:hypothetical protein